MLPQQRITVMYPNNTRKPCATQEMARRPLVLRHAVEQMAQVRFERGRAAHVAAGHTQFHGDPTAEALEEALDGMNYCDEGIRQGQPGLAPVRALFRTAAEHLLSLRQGK
jgi:hypothetical protein